MLRGLVPGFIAVVAYDLTKGFDSLKTVHMRVGALKRYFTNWLHDNFDRYYHEPADGYQVATARVPGSRREVVKGSTARRFLLKRLVVLLALAVVVVSGVLAYRYLEGVRTLPEGLIQANGRIGGDTMIVASKVAGRVVALFSREGDTVEAGQVVARLEDKTARARVAQAHAAREVAAARMQATHAAFRVLSQEVPTTSLPPRPGWQPRKRCLRRRRRLQNRHTERPAASAN
jgi:multidrug resistance efflux pump